MPLAPDLMAILRCPKCLGEVLESQTAEGPGLVCGACKLVYPIVDDIPQCLVDAARPL